MIFIQRTKLASSPDRFEGNLKLGVVIDYFLQIGPIGITPTALVETEGKVLLHGRQSDGTGLILPDHV